MTTRRKLLQTVGLASGTAILPRWGFASAPKNIKFGYTAMTWGKEEKQAIEDISALGYAGIQFRIDAVTEFKPAELEETLAAHKLTFVALSSGEVSLDAPEQEEISKHVANAKFVKESGGLYLQVLDALKTYPRTVTTDECRRLGTLLTKIGEQTADLGVPLCYHNHMNTISEKPENLNLVLASSDPKYVKLELDTAHSVAGGGDPAQAIAKYHERLLFLHLKDEVPIPVGSEKSKYPFKFVELGKGKVDLPAVFAALDKVGFSGWAVVELDRVPNADKTPKECAETSRDYLRQVIGVKV